MNGALPLLRTLEPAVRQSWSRIPHITAHILQRQCQRRAHVIDARHIQRQRQRASPNPSNAWTGKPASAQPVHHVSTLVLDGREEVDERDDVMPLPVDEESRTNTQDRAPDKKMTGQARLRAIRTRAVVSPPMQDYLDQAHPERVLHAFLHPQIGPPFIAEASDQDFARAFELLDPKHFLEERKAIDRNIHPKLYTRFKIRKSSILGDKFDWYTKCLEDIMAQRRLAGHPMTLDIYRHLLSWTEAMGAESLARDLFESAMPQDGIDPDLPSYNHYLGACVWNGAFDVDYRFKIRNVALNFVIRERHMVNKAASKQITALKRPRFERPEGETIRSHALSVFADLTKRGHKPDEATFVNLMFAMAQNRDIDGVKSVLKSVWNIDVDLLGRYDEEEIESPTFYDDGHPLRPSPRLLHAVVYVFATNNDPFNASFLLDYISRNYNVPIPHDIWMLVFEFTFVLCERFSAKRSQRGYAQGQLPEDALAKFAETITDEPHNVKPNTWMVEKLSHDARRSQNLEATLRTFRNALVLREEHMTLVSRLYDEMLVACHNLNLELDPVPSAEFLDKRRTFVHESLKLDRDLEALRLQSYHIFNDSWQFGISPWHSDQWSVRTVPSLIREFEYFLPRYLVVRAQGFVYSIENTKWHKERVIADTNDQFDVKCSRLRNLLEEENPEKLHYRARQARKIVTGAEDRCMVCKKKGEHSSNDCPRWEVGLAGHGLEYGEAEVKFVDHLETPPWGPHTQPLPSHLQPKRSEQQDLLWRPPLSTEEERMSEAQVDDESQQLTGKRS